jgi:hypothetical protein
MAKFWMGGEQYFVRARRGAQRRERKRRKKKVLTDRASESAKVECFRDQQPPHFLTLVEFTALEAQHRCNNEKAGSRGGRNGDKRR